MKLTMNKAMMAKVTAVGLVAGAFALAAPQKAEAQVQFGVVVGAPPVVAYAPGYYARRDYYERLRCEREREREARERHEAWEHRRDFDRWHEHDWDHDQGRGWR